MTTARNDGTRIGIPFRTRREWLAGAAKGKKIEYYYRAVRDAGGEPVPISLDLDPTALRRLADSLDAFVLPGSPADVDPARYGQPQHAKTAPRDESRERTDWALLDHALATGKPVLAICYGNQLLNVYRGGSLIQDIPSEPATAGSHLAHTAEQGDYPEHPVHLAAGSRLASLAGSGEARVNSSHHQSILAPGSGLRVTARAPDGVIEGVEWEADSNWIVGVQWHPERMEGDAFSAALFRQLVAEARQAAVKH
jgi:putative glutamine amidotransferase